MIVAPEHVLICHLGDTKDAFFLQHQPDYSCSKWAALVAERHLTSSARPLRRSVHEALEAGIPWPGTSDLQKLRSPPSPAPDTRPSVRPERRSATLPRRTGGQRPA